MNLILLPDGKPTEHLGISHMLRHWCRPQELWEDLLLPPEPLHTVPSGCRPPILWELLAAARQVPEQELPWVGLDWERLRVPYRQGYAAVVTALAVALPPPPQAPWVRHPKGYWMAHIGAGVLLGVKARRNDNQFHTAYRATDFKLRNYRCPPQDPQSVSLRRRIAEHQAAQRLAHLARGSDDDS